MILPPLARYAALLGLLASLPGPAFADDALTFTPELQLRTRAEGDTGRDSDATKGDVFFVTQRSRLGGTLAWGDRYSGHIVVSDVRTFGEEAHTRRDYAADGLDVRIAVMDIRLRPQLHLRLGRDEVSFMDERLLAKANWRQPGRSFDGLRLTWTPEGASAESMIFLLDEGDVTDFAAGDQATPDGPDSWIWLSRGGLDTSAAALQAVAVVDHLGPKELTRLTAGAFAHAGKGPISARIEAYGQTGSQGEDALRAALLGASLTFSGADRPTQPSLTLWYDLMTGDTDPDDGVLTTFDTLYGANHRYYGHIDMATYVVGGKVGDAGLQDLALKLAGRPAPKAKGLKAALDLHLFTAAPGMPDPLLGAEADASLAWRVAAPFTLSVGGSLWQPLDGGEAVDVFGWVMADLRL